MNRNSRFPSIGVQHLSGSEGRDFASRHGGVNERASKSRLTPAPWSRKVLPPPPGTIIRAAGAPDAVWYDSTFDPLAAPVVKVVTAQPRRVSDGPIALPGAVPANFPIVDYTVPLVSPRMRRLNGNPVRTLDWDNGDPRRLFKPVGYPYHCVGVVRVTDIHGTMLSGGTGALVGPHLVLTAAHVFPWELVSNGVANFKVSFWPAFFGPAYQTHIIGPNETFAGAKNPYGAKDWPIGLVKKPPPLPWWQGWRPVNFIFNYSKHDEVSAWDMALLQLADSGPGIGDWQTGLGHFGILAFDPSSVDPHDWRLIGYSQTFQPLAPGQNNDGSQPSIQDHVTIVDVDHDGKAIELETDAFTMPGDSGGPIWAWTNPNGQKLPHIIGVVGGWEKTPTEYHNTVAAGGKAMVDLVQMHFF